MQPPVSLHVVCVVGDDGVNQGFHVVRIHLSVTCHHHADEWRIPQTEEMLVATVDGGAHTVAVSFQDHDITRRIGMAGERTCVVFRAIVDDHGQVNHLGKAGQHGLDVLLFVASGDDHAEKSSVVHDFSVQVANINLCVNRPCQRLERTGFIALERSTNSVKVPLRRVVLIGENIELRIVSLVVRCREVAEDVVLFDTGSTDETTQLAEEVDTQVVHYKDDLTPQRLARAAIQASLNDGLTLFLPITSMWKLSALPLSVNRAREGWDIHYLYRESPSVDDNSPHVIATTQWVI